MSIKTSLVAGSALAVALAIGMGVTAQAQEMGYK